MPLQNLKDYFRKRASSLLSQITKAKRGPELQALLRKQSSQHNDVPPAAAPIREFITGSYYLNKPNFWPRALDDLERLKAPGIKGGVIEVGIGGGKSYLSSTLPLFDIYTLEHMQAVQGIDLYQRFELDPDSPVYVAVIAANGKIAREVYRYMRAFAEGCAWFQDHLHFDPTITSELQFRRPGETLVRYIAYPGHSKVTSVISRNIFSYVLDEANFFTRAESAGSSGKDYAEELDEQLGSRVDSRFGESGFRNTISSRNTVNDFTARKKARLRSDPDTAKQYYLPEPRTSWANWPEERCKKDKWRLFDPLTCNWIDAQIYSYAEIKDRSGFFVPERFWGEFSTNPEKALKNLGSIPSDAVSPFIRRRDLIRPAFAEGDESGMESPVLPGVKATDWLKVTRFDELVADWFYGLADERYHFHVDLALSRDACGIALARNSGMDPVALSKSDRRPEKAALIDVEAIFQLRAPPKGEIEFAQVRRILYWLRDERGFRFHYSSYDGWQSKDSQQILTRRGFLIEELSVDRNKEAYTNLKDALYEGRLFFPPAHGQTPNTTWNELYGLADKGDPCAIFQRELSQLEDISDKKVDHPANGSKDLADAVAGAVTMALRYPQLTRDVISGSDNFPFIR